MKDLGSCSAERIQHTLQEDLAEVEETRRRKTNIIIHLLQEPTSGDQDEHRDISRIWKVGGCKIKVGGVSSRSENFFFSTPQMGCKHHPMGGCKHPRI